MGKCSASIEQWGIKHSLNKVAMADIVICPEKCASAKGSSKQ